MRAWTFVEAFRMETWRLEAALAMAKLAHDAARKGDWSPLHALRDATGTTTDEARTIALARMIALGC